MTKLNLTKKENYKKDRTVSINDPSKLLAEFFNGVVIQIDKEYSYES